ncbi:class II aldolase/adducin family protein [Halobellus captivus]|uniref:class II aldolase/adducin family protein n=1 Tax=Halobellus captivus TaxID=2592614 RepID=UPI001396A20E|nr:class II aldolase/adducin family protein [Halobellus captivus]
MRRRLVDQLVTANRILANEGIIRGFGHVSVRDPETETVLISQSRSPAFVTEGDILELTLDGEVLDDDRTTYLENVIHRAIYRARPDVNAVVHHHAESVIPFAITDVEMRPVTHKGMMFYDGVPKFDDYDEERGYLIATEAEGERMAENLGDHRAQLLAGHGANTVGGSLKEAICVTYNFVLNARNQLDGESLGEITFAPESESMVRTTVEEAELSDGVVERLWEYLSRQLPERSK